MKSPISVKWPLLLVFLFVFSQCKEDKKELLCRKWRTVAFENKKMQEQIRYFEHFIDTLKYNSNDYASPSDLDSLKKGLQSDLDAMREEQRFALENNTMEFRSNGVTYTTSIEGSDSAMYEIEDGNMIRIDESKLKGVGETLTFEILKLNKDTLKIRFVDYGDTSVATMVPIR